MQNNKTKTIVVAHNTAKYLLMHYRQLLFDLKKEFDNVICVAPEDGFEHRFEKLGFDFVSIDVQQHGTNPLKEWKLVKEFSSIYKKYQPDAVLNFSIKPCLYGGYAAKKLGVEKAGYMVTGLGYIFLTSGFKAKLLKKLTVSRYRKNLRKQDHVFFQNKDDAKLFEDFQITNSAKTHVLPGTGIDLKEFPFSKKNSDQISQVRFLYIGRMLKDKGLVELVKACYALRKLGCSFQCDLVGPLDTNPSAIKFPEIQSWQKKNLIRYHGETEDIKQFLKDSHVFVLPSYREGLPRAGLEAMSMGLPIITTDVPGCREIVEHGVNGLLVEAKHSTPLAKSMKRFIDDKSMIEKMGKKSRLICEEKFSVEIVSDMVCRAMGSEG